MTAPSDTSLPCFTHSGKDWPGATAAATLAQAWGVRVRFWIYMQVFPLRPWRGLRWLLARRKQGVRAPEGQPRETQRESSAGRSARPDLKLLFVLGWLLSFMLNTHK